MPFPPCRRMSSSAPPSAVPLAAPAMVIRSRPAPPLKVKKPEPSCAMTSSPSPPLIVTGTVTEESMNTESLPEPKSPSMLRTPT